MIYTSPTYRKLRRQKLLQRSLAGVAARERNRLAGPGPDWRLCRIITVLDPQTGLAHRWLLHADTDRHMTLTIDGTMHRAGSERTIRSLLAKAMWTSAQKWKG